MKKINVSVQQFNDLKESGKVVVGLDFTPTPGKRYSINQGDEKIEAKCSQWFGPPLQAYFITDKI
jgi:hypothetical protein